VRPKVTTDAYGDVVESPRLMLAELRALLR
jgi:hypothetical protein